MKLPWKHPTEHLVEFNHYEIRIKAIETQLNKQRIVNEIILAYVEANMSSAKDLAEALHEALKE